MQLIILTPLNKKSDLTGHQGLKMALAFAHAFYLPFCNCLLLCGSCPVLLYRYSDKCSLSQQLVESCFSSTLCTFSLTPERMTSCLFLLRHFQSAVRLCIPVESINGTLRIRMIRTFGRSPSCAMVSSNFVAMPKK